MTEQRSYISNMYWLGAEFLKFCTSPVAAAGSLLDCARGWRYSRTWIRLVLNAPAFIVLAFVYLAFGFSLFERTDTRVQRYGVKSEQICTTGTLENLVFQSFPFLNPSFATGTPPSPSPINELKLRFVRLLNERIIETQPGDTNARYRTALVNLIGDESDRKKGIEEMQKLAENKVEAFQPANAWIAAYMLQKERDNPNSQDGAKLFEHLKLASQWRDVRAPLLIYYAKILAANGMTGDAIHHASQAAKKNPEFNLELQRLYHIVGNAEGVRTAGYIIEEVFGQKLNTASERAIDRLAIAESRFLMGKPDSAMKVLTDGLERENINGKKEFSRMLSNIRISMFEKSIQRLDDGTHIADLSLLDQAVDADADNPRISEQVSKLVPLKIKPSKRVLGVFKKQIESGISSGDSHRSLGDAYALSGNRTEAMRNWELAIQKNPKDFASHNNLALFLARDTNPDLKRAIELIKTADSLSPNNPEVLDSYGQILILANMPGEAIAKLENAIRVDPKRINTRKLLLETYRQLQMHDLANAQAKIIESISQSN